MNDQPEYAAPPSAIRFEPGVPVIKNVNWGGLKTLYIKEVRRFFKVQLQTIWAVKISISSNTRGILLNCAGSAGDVRP